MRNIQNQQQVVDAIKENTGLDVNVISGEEEGICGFIGASYNLDIDSGLLIDIGGGSTEFVFYKDKKIYKTYSVPMGSLSLYEKYVTRLIPKKDEYKKIKRYVQEQLETIISENFIFSITYTSPMITIALESVLPRIKAKVFISMIPASRY